MYSYFTKHIQPGWLNVTELEAVASIARMQKDQRSHHPSHRRAKLHTKLKALKNSLNKGPSKNQKAPPKPNARYSSTMLVYRALQKSPPKPEVRSMQHDVRSAHISYEEAPDIELDASSQQHTRGT